MWRFIGVLSLLLLPCTFGGDIKPCPANNVCLIFSRTSCHIGKAQIKSDHGDIGAVWPTKCVNDNYEKAWAFIKIEVISGEKYKFDIAFYDRIEGHKLTFIREDKDRNPISQSQFTFQKPRDEEYTAHLEFNYLDSSKEIKNGSVPSIKMTQLEKIPLSWTRQNLGRYSFEVHLKGVKLINIFKSDKIVADIYEHNLVGSNQEYKLELVDDRYNPQLSALNPCLESEVTCFENNCGKLSFSNSSTANCTATLRYWNPSESSAFTRTWTKFERIECEMASWRAVFAEEGKGAVVLTSAYEVDCSEQEPESMTDYFKIVIGSVGGVVLLIFIVTIITVGFCARRLRRNRRNQLTLASMSAGSIAMTPTTRRASLKASETNRETNRDAMNI